MPCIHGLDENNCPTCRIARSTIPVEELNVKSLNVEDIKPENAFFKQHRVQKNDFENEISYKRNQLKPNLIQNIPNPTLLNIVPNFENKLYQERLNELKLTRLDNFGISKRIKLDNPNLKLKEDE
ncbi:MAG: hypothetical protein ACFE85_06690 [Candidatus Hodarchaeota archaeon]